MTCNKSEVQDALAEILKRELGDQLTEEEILETAKAQAEHLGDGADLLSYEDDFEDEDCLDEDDFEDEVDC